ncbi:Receptor-like protein 12 [Morella rubra]|uniref:Receptor-like protein 12 n=1 Tax=Morella rubra TaxID=262757 RepID=A0A6A1WPQ0_9ROSI|nr:Receptor-like protein 12 [Morella rubra]
MSKKLAVIALSKNLLTGQITSTRWEELLNLALLDLSFNSLEGSIPVSLFYHPSLEQLLLSKNQFSGQLDEFSNVSSHILSVLDLSSNNLEGAIPMSMFDFQDSPLPNLSNLFVVDLRSNQLQGPLPILKPNVNFVDFSWNNFSSNIPVNIGNWLPNTIFFSLASNRFQGSIPESICNAAPLEVLDLSNNSFSGTIPRCLTSMNLGVLDLKRNSLTGTIPDTFSEQCALHTLDVNGNLLDGKLPESLASCTQLELQTDLLEASNKNRFVWKAMMDDKKEVHSKLGHLQFSSLDRSVYYLNTIRVTYKGLEKELVKILTIFTSLDFSCNNFDVPIPVELEELRLLYVLNLSHNAFTGHIPSSVGKLSHLELLDLSSNELAGEIPLQLADGLIFLSVLNLSFNQLVGQIPSIKQFPTFSEMS